MIRPVYASGWFDIQISEAERQALITSGLVPVNDKMMPFWERNAKVWLFEGGRGGGKSEGVFDRLVRNCLEDKYFNAYYGRKVWDTVHKSCFETLVNSIKKQKKEHLFTFSEKDNSSMVVRAYNGNKFVPFGADKAEKMKSIKDPSHIICEEFDQFELQDFRDLFPALRTPKAYCEFVGMYNSWGVLPDHWLNKLFFPELYQGDDKNHYNALEGVDVQKIFINYNDNYFIDQTEYLTRLRLAAAGNEQIFQSLAYGARGVIPNDNPWCYSFDFNRHCRPLNYIASAPVYLSFDFNCDPFVCVAFQHSQTKGSKDSYLFFINEFSGVIKLEEMCQRIKSKYPNAIFFVTGDRSGQNEDIGRNQTLYQMIANLLGLSPKQMNLNKANLTHADSRMLCNTMLYHYPHFFIDSEKCKLLIADIQKATVDKESMTGSALMKDRGTYKMDLFDAWRYGLQTYFHEFAKKAYYNILK